MTVNEKFAYLSDYAYNLYCSEVYGTNYNVENEFFPDGMPIPEPEAEAGDTTIYLPLNHWEDGQARREAIEKWLAHEGPCCSVHKTGKGIVIKYPRHIWIENNIEFIREYVLPDIPDFNYSPYTL